MKTLSKITILPIILLLLYTSALAQIPSGYVQTTATVAPLANGSYGASWTNLSSSPQLALLGCVSTFQQTVSGSFDAYGHLSVLLADTAQICPSPSTWNFNITFSCPVGTPTSSFQVQVAVVGGGGTEDISTQIVAALPASPCNGGGGGGGGASLKGYPINVPAIADNVTDNTAVIQTAINTASFTGQDVFIPSAPAGYCYEFTKLYWYYDAVLNPGYNQSGGWSFNFGGNRTSVDNDGDFAGNSTATTCLTSTDATGPALNVGGGPGFFRRAGTSTITQTSMSSGTATFNWTLVSGAAPANGNIVQIGGTTNGNYQFNLQGGVIASVSGTTSGTFIVTGILPASTIGSQAETGTANYGIYNYNFQSGSIHDFTLNISSTSPAIAADLITSSPQFLHDITINQSGAGNGVVVEDVWENVTLSSLTIYSFYGKTYAAAHGGIYPSGTAGLKICNNIAAGLVQVDKVLASYFDHGHEYGSVNSITNCGAEISNLHVTHSDGTANNIGFWVGHGPVAGGIEQSYAEITTASSFYLGSYLQGPFYLKSNLLGQATGATGPALNITQVGSAYPLSNITVENNFFLTASSTGIQINDSGGLSSGMIKSNSIQGIPYDVALPATSVKWTLENNTYVYGNQNQTSASRYIQDAGFVETINMLLTANGGFAIPAGETYNLGEPNSTISADGSSDNYYTAGLNHYFQNATRWTAQIDSSGNLYFGRNASGFYGEFQPASPFTANRVFTLPDSGGNIMVSGAGGPAYTVGTNFNINNGSGTGILELGTTGQLLLSDGYALYAKGASDGFYSENAAGNVTSHLTASGDLVIDISGSNKGTLTSSNTAARTYTFPDASGTIALVAGGVNIGGGVLGSAVYQTGVGSTGTTAANTTTSTLCFTETGTGSVGAAPVWSACSGSAATAWSAVTGATNTGQAMLVGNGSTFGVTGTGTIAATTSANLAGGAAGNISYQGAASTTAFDNLNLYYNPTGGPSSSPSLAVGPRGSNTLYAVFDAFESIAGQYSAAFYNTGAQSSTGGALITLLMDPGAAMTTGSRLGSVQYGGNYTSPLTTGVGASIDGVAAGNWSGTSYPTNLLFYTTSVGSTTLTQALKIDSAQTATFANLPILPGTGWVYANNSTVATVTTTPSFATGTTAVTQATADSSSDLATNLFVHNVVGTVIADVQFTVSNATVVGASPACLGPFSVSMPGVSTSTSFTLPTPMTDAHAATGWANPAPLYFYPYPTANNYNYYLCNSSTASVTTSASVTFNVGAR